MKFKLTQDAQIRLFQGDAPEIDRPSIEVVDGGEMICAFKFDAIQITQRQDGIDLGLCYQGKVFAQVRSLPALKVDESLNVSGVQGQHFVRIRS
jgi:hypothetical protein